MYKKVPYIDENGGIEWRTTNGKYSNKNPAKNEKKK